MIYLFLFLFILMCFIPPQQMMQIMKQGKLTIEWHGFRSYVIYVSLCIDNVMFLLSIAQNWQT